MDLVSDDEDERIAVQAQVSRQRWRVSDLDCGQGITSISECREQFDRIGHRAPRDGVLCTKGSFVHPSMVAARRVPREIDMLDPQGITRSKHCAHVERGSHVLDNN